ncbi:MAG: M23 family metallopeptidase [Bacteroidota bacterium]
MPFGRQPHPRVPSVTINNGGIDIDGGRGARVQAVFAGKIISIREIPGYRNTIMVRHGNYYTVYSNLEKVLVKVGEEIEARATIGYTSRGGDPIHFELWKGRDRQDPSKWLN